jgi:hypothetical protein
MGGAAMETLVENFDAIAAAQLDDVNMIGDAIISESQPSPDIPFGAELLTETPDDAAHLGKLACVQNMTTQVDDSVIIGTTGSDN